MSETGHSQEPIRRRRRMDDTSAPQVIPTPQTGLNEPASPVRRRRGDAPVPPVPPAAYIHTPTVSDDLPVRRITPQQTPQPRVPSMHTSGDFGYTRIPAQPRQPVTPRRVPVGVEKPQPAAKKPPIRQKTVLQNRKAHPNHVETVIAPQDPAPRSRFPWPMAVTVCILAIALAALSVGNVQMRQWLTRQQDAREAAHQAVVNAHPIRYADLITAYADQNNLQPAFVEAIILNESSFNPMAESNVGARGLMQLMPDTAEWIAGRLGIKGFSFDMMYDPETNIRFGTWYLSYLAKMFGGDCPTVAAAYHAGQGTVTGWITSGAYTSNGSTLDVDKLMDGPTKTYARRVTRAYAIYEALYYAAPEPDAADSTDAV